MLSTAVVVSAAAILVASPRRRWEALPSAIGIAIVAAVLIAGGYGFSDSSFFIAFCALIVCLLVSLTVQMRRQRREHESALLRAARLEIELLKKSIQPHFLMNTLTAIMEWIEEDPREGVHFLQALADELRIFAEVAGEEYFAEIFAARRPEERRIIFRSAASRARLSCARHPCARRLFLGRECARHPSPRLPVRRYVGRLLCLPSSSR